MKKNISFVLLAIVALFANATDRFYITDFSISPGETRTISINLDNEIAYTAFQSDLTKNPLPLPSVRIPTMC